jgi:protein O-GlcNAc transferase
LFSVDRLAALIYCIPQQSQGACAAFSNAVRLNPASADDFNNLACVYKDLGALQEAIYSYRQALCLVPDNPNVFCNLVHSLQMVCDWAEYEPRMAHLSHIVEEQLRQGQFPSVHPHHTFLYRLSNTTRRAIAAAHANAASQKVTAPAHTFNHPRGALTTRLRIGYVSSDFKVRLLC